MKPQPHLGPRSPASALAWAALALLGGLLVASGAAAASQAQAAAGELHAPAPSAAARAWARRVVGSQDHAGLPFVVVDKRAAQVVLHAADGSVVGSSAALLGSALGDHSVPGVGERTQAGTLRPSDMTTPAGRFAARPGQNHTGDHVLWLDEADALALHRLRPGRLHAMRVRALAASDPSARRLSAGCVVVPALFFDRWVTPLLGRQGGVVYVLPENGQWPASLAELPLAGG